MKRHLCNRTITLSDRGPLRTRPTGPTYGTRTDHERKCQAADTSDVSAAQHRFRSARLDPCGRCVAARYQTVSSVPMPHFTPPAPGGSREDSWHAGPLARHFCPRGGVVGPTGGRNRSSRRLWTGRAAPHRAPGGDIDKSRDWPKPGVGRAFAAAFGVVAVTREACGDSARGNSSVNPEKLSLPWTDAIEPPGDC